MLHMQIHVSIFTLLSREVKNAKNMLDTYKCEAKLKFLELLPLKYIDTTSIS